MKNENDDDKMKKKLRGSNESNREKGVLVVYETEKQ